MSQAAIRIDAYLEEETGALPTLADDVRRGLRGRWKSLPPKYLYDDRGSELFERICRTPEYYVTRTESALLERVAPDVVRRVRPRDLVELGPGSSRKTRAFLDKMRSMGLLERYVPVDVSLGMVEEAARALAASYPGLAIRGVIGDFHKHLDKVPKGECRLVIFLGSTIGNFHPADAVQFLRKVAAGLGPRDAFLLGADLVKDVGVLEAAYNDARGVTAEFNKNVLRVINRNLGADFDPERFDHLALYNRRRRRIEIYLVSREDQEVRISDLPMTVRLRRGQRICTEHSHKFTRASLRSLIRRAGMRLDRWYTDPKEWFALALARPAGS